MFNVLLFEPMHEDGIAILRAVSNVRFATATDEDSILAQIADVDGVIVRSRGAMTRRIMEAAPRLKVVGRHGVGVDNIDIAAATELGIQVVYTPAATIESVAEHTVGLMLAVSKKITWCDAITRAGNFDARYGLQGREMYGRPLGIIGCGRIGRRVAEICHLGFNMPILYHDCVQAEELERTLGARRVPLEELLSTAEYITVHVPLLPSTRGLIGAAEFALMRPDALFFNTSRGPVVDERALCQALTEKRIAGAGIDVFAQEPTPPDNPLLKLDNVVLTPHVASSTAEAMRNMSLVAEDIVAVLQGRPPTYPVNRLSNR